MSFFSGKKIFLLGFILVLLVAIPLTVYLAQQQQKTRSGAAPSTTLSIVESGKTNSSVIATVDQTISFDIMANPGSNQVSFVKFTLNYDGTKIATTDAGLVANTTTGLPNIASGPTYDTNSVSITLNVGASPQQSLTLPTKLATISFKAIASTDGVPTRITFADAQAMSSGGESAFNENVFSTSSPADITISGSSVVPTVTVEPTVAPTAEPTVAPTAVPTQTTNISPTCSSLAVDVSSGSAPLVSTFTAVGADSDGTIAKATFNYGDGVVEDVTQGGNLGTANVSLPHSHTFNSAGTFTANVVFTDDRAGVSTPSGCSQTITVSPGTITPAPTETAIAPTAIPTALPPTGPGEQIMAIGAFGVIISIIGAILLFAL